MLSIMGEVAGASASAAGLILVFFGASLAGFDSYDETQKAAVRVSYRFRAWPGFGGLIAALASCALALSAKATNSEPLAFWAATLLGVVGLAVLIAAFVAMLDIG